MKIYMGSGKNGNRITLVARDNKFNSYLPIINQYADNLDISVVVDTNPIPIRPKINSKDTVNLFLNSYPVNPRSLHRSSPDVIFGYPTPDNFSLVEVDATNFDSHSKSILITSPEGLNAGCVYPGNIWIYPTILDSEAWINGEDKNILKIILHMYLSEAFVLGSDTRLYNKVFIDGYNNLKKISREELCNSQSKPVFDGVSEYIEKSFILAIEKINENIKRVLAEAEGLSQKDYDTLSNIVETEMRIETAKQAVENRNFGGEFDEIISMQHIQCLRVVNLKENHQAIVVFTDTILQIPNSLSDESFDIGSFEILIDPILSTRAGVNYYQSRRVGHFEHKFVAEKNVCFGQVLNPAVDKLISSFDIVPLIHMALSFLIKESSMPERKKLGMGALSSNFGSPHYVDEDDRNSEKRNFIDLVKTKILSNMIAVASIELKRLKELLITIRKERSEKRGLIGIFRQELRVMEKHLSTVSSLSEAQVQNLLNNKHVFWMIANPDMILIYFDSPYLENSFFRQVKGFVLKIQRGHHLKLEFGKSQLLELTRSGFKQVTEETEKHIHNSRLLGKISDVLAITEDIIAGGLPKS